jgi:hypothetical protein
LNEWCVKNQNGCKQNFSLGWDLSFRRVFEPTLKQSGRANLRETLDRSERRFV